MDLFSGIGGISLALSPWVRPIIYCEIERYPQSVLLSRMAEGHLPRAPIWDDIQTLDGKPWRGIVDIIYGGFPCQDISLAGAGAGLGGRRSGLFFEIVRLAEEIEPAFIFCENVPAIRTRGLDRVVGEFSRLGYDCRWCTLSAQQIGAPHVRNRWFILAANSNRLTLGNESFIEERQKKAVASPNGKGQSLANTYGARKLSGQKAGGLPSDGPCARGTLVANTAGAGLEISGRQTEFDPVEQTGWWSFEPAVGRVANGCPNRVDRIKSLGNGVVPLQARTAFRRLMWGAA